MVHVTNSKDDSTVLDIFLPIKVVGVCYILWVECMLLLHINMRNVKDVHDSEMLM